MESLLHTQGVAMRTSRVVDPGSLVQPRSLDDECIIIHPLAYRIAEPTRFPILGDLASVCPDHSPYSAKLVQQVDCYRRLEDLGGSELEKVFPRNSLRIARDNRIIRFRRQ